jgi:hypothetical protein
LKIYLSTEAFWSTPDEVAAEDMEARSDGLAPHKAVNLEGFNRRHSHAIVTKKYLVFVFCRDFSQKVTFFVQKVLQI